MTDKLQCALEAVAAGGLIVVADDLARVPRGFALMRGQDATAQRVNELVDFAKGVVCAALSKARAKALGLEHESLDNNELVGLATRSVEAATGVTTGISAADRARTLAVLADDASTAADLVSPGHIFPFVAHPAGVLGQGAEAELAVDLMRLAGQSPVGGFCHLLGDDGNLAGIAELEDMAASRGLPLVRASEVHRYRMEREFFVHRTGGSSVDTSWGRFEVHVYENELDGVAHPVLVYGSLATKTGGPLPLVRVHSQCLTGDVFGSLRCDCGDQLAGALEKIAQEGAGALVYLRQEGRGIGLVNKIRAYALQDKGKDTVDANLELGFAPDQRSFVVAAQILKSLGAKEIRLITNNPRKIREMEQFGVLVAERVSMPVTYREENARYLEVKADRLGHLLELGSLP